MAPSGEYDERFVLGGDALRPASGSFAVGGNMFVGLTNSYHRGSPGQVRGNAAACMTRACNDAEADLIVHRLEELQFFFQSLALVLGVDVLQRLLVQVLHDMPQRIQNSLCERSSFHYDLNKQVNRH